MVSLLEYGKYFNSTNERGTINHFNNWLKTKDKHKKFIEEFYSRHSFGNDALTHSISELPICNVVEEPLFPLPVDFEIVCYDIGAVSVFDNQDLILTEDIQHAYARSGNYVFCVSFAQFYDYQYDSFDKYIPGERIRKYQNLAPDLVHDLGDGVAVLFGPRNQIQKKLHLLYK